MITTERHESTADLSHVAVDSAQLAYREKGTGEPVVLVHGSLCDLTIWDPIFDRIAEHHRAFAYSRRWAWPNEPIPAEVPDSIDRHALDLATFIERLGLGPANLVGNSFGAFTCLVVARDRPDLVSRVVAQEPPVIPLLVGFPPRPSALVKLLVTRPRTGLPLARAIVTGLGPATAAARRGDVEASIEIFLRKAALGEAHYQAIPDWVMHHMRLNAATHVAQMLNNGGFAPFTPEDARSVGAPVLVMTGAESGAATRVMARELARWLPNRWTVDIAGASHVMHLDRPSETAAAILDFLAIPPSTLGRPGPA